MSGAVRSIAVFVALATAVASADAAVRPCRYVPGVSVTAVMPSSLGDRPRRQQMPASVSPTVTKVPAETTALQRRVLDGLANAVRDQYVYPDYRGHDWNAMTAAARALIQRGMTDADFYVAMSDLISRLGDREALKSMTADAPLQGLILDNRVNGGGLGSVTQSILGLFAKGIQGDFVSRTGRQPLNLKPEDIGGSQTVPLVVLVDSDTVSYGEIMSGVLRVAGRARIVGGQTLGNVERLRAFNFPDGSRAWIATDTF